jgi:hypothetical protein
MDAIPLARREEVLTVDITSPSYVFPLEVRLVELPSIIEVLLPSKSLYLPPHHLEFLKPPSTIALSSLALTLINTL